MKSFIDDYILGNASYDDIDDYIDRWHEGDSDKPLHEYLGLTFDEYSDWLTTGDFTENIEEKHKDYGYKF